MDPARWDRIRHIYGLVIERPTSERPVLLGQLCGGDAELRAEVESLLGQHDADPDFLEEPLMRLGADEESPRDAAGTRIDRYRILRPIGRGGMGEVHLAVQEDESFERHVALKVIRPGLDTAEVLQRFRLERQILASLHHPNIAQLLDAGATEDGRPYFVMEYVEGVPIDEYCDGRRLTVAARLRLFHRVCAAVQHAHQNLVVHRDLKPSNILVGPDDVPKLLDFGIGKVLAPTSSLSPGTATRTAMRMMTPEYAAPEQIRGAAVSTGTDVYGLGVLLYELLTGHRPYGAGATSLEEIERAVCEETPSRPSAVVTRPETRRRPDGETVSVSPQDVGNRRSTDPQRLRKRLSGDLDNILLMALRKEPERRYPSAAAFAEDVERHLAGLPVRARPDTVTYRMSKFVQRHAMGVTAAAAAVLALVTTSVITLIQSQRVALERDRAVEERAKAIEVRGFLMEMFGATAPDEQRDTVTVRQLLDRQAERVDEIYPNQPELRAEMIEVLADGYERLGLLEEAESLARRALETRRDLFGDDHPDVASTANLLGWILHERGQANEARPLLEQAVATRRSGGRERVVELSRSLNDLGIVIESLGDLEGAEQLFREALAIRRAHLGDQHRSVGITANNLAGSLYRQAKFDSAVTVQSQAVRALDASVGPDHQRSTIALTNLAFMQRRAGDSTATVQTFRELLQRQERAQGRNHPITALAIQHLATALSARGDFEEAEELLREALAIRRNAFGPTHPDVSSTLGVLGSVLGRQDRVREAESAYLEALQINMELWGESHYETAGSLADVGLLYRDAGRHNEAVPYLRRAATASAASRGRSHPQTLNFENWHAVALLETDAPARALEILASTHTTALEIEHPLLIRITRLRLAEAHIGLDQIRVADSLLAVAGADSTELSDGLRQLMDRLRESIR